MQGQVGKNLTQIQADNLTQFYVNFFGSDRRSNVEKLSLDRAKRFLNVIQPEIKQRLRDTVHQNIWFNPELEEQPQQVGGLAPNRLVKLLGKPEELLDIQTTILEVFVRSDIRGKLLILGEPGVGKTTTLLALADQLVQQALNNPGTTIPVIFELSAWKDDRQSIQEWLEEQLRKIDPQITTAIARRWIEEGLLLPLLDGLDELGERQSICVQGLNEFVEQYPGLPLVVCCRAEEYLTGAIKLNHRRGAVCLQPLTPHQVQDYLQQVEQLELWNAIETQLEMQILLSLDSNGKPGILQIPLFLKIAAEAYTGKSFSSKIGLLSAYIDRRLSPDMRKWERETYKNRKWAHQKITEEPDWRKTWHYLSWLAQNFKKINQIEFSVEAMQPSWLMTRRQKRTYFWVSGVTSAGISGCAYLLMLPLIVEKPISSLLRVAKSPPEISISSLLYWLNQPLNDSSEISELFAGLAGVIFSAAFGIIIVMAAWHQSHQPILPSTKSLLSLESLKLLPNALPWVLIGGLLCGTVAVFSGLFNGQIAKTSLLGLFVGGGLGVLGWILVEWIFNRQSDDFWDFHSSNELSIELSSNRSYSTADRKANQGILNASTNALAIALLIAIFTGLAGVVGGKLIGEPSSLLPGFLEVLGFGIFWGFLCGGGIEGIKHLILRCILSRDGYIPWNYGQFLNYCVERRLLRRIGNRYRFLHRELLEHFSNNGGGTL